MNEQKREMILKALVDFKGVWPDGYEALIVSTEENDCWGAVKYQDFTTGKDGFHDLMEGQFVWEWVCTRAEFESVLDELAKDAPEGAEYYCINKYCVNYWKKLGGKYQGFSKVSDYYLLGSVHALDSDELIPLPSKVNGAMPCFFKEEGKREKPDFAWPSYDSQSIPFPSKMDEALEQVVVDLEPPKAPLSEKFYGTIERPNIFLGGEYVPNLHPTDNVEFEHQIDFTKNGLATSYYKSDDGYSLKITQTKTEADDWMPEVGVECEYSINKNFWHICKVLCYGYHFVFMKSHKANKDGYKEYCIELPKVRFRHLKAEAEKKQERLALDLWRSINHNDKTPDDELLTLQRFKDYLTAIKCGWRPTQDKGQK